MSMYERTCRIDNTERASKGVITGILATNGEASDGHILNIAGAELPERMPLLFGHDDHSGRGNLGSWVDFQAEDGVLRGTAQIEMSGSGDQADFRTDVAHMVARGHISAFSIRWDATEPPIERTKLDEDHFAYVSSSEKDPRKRHGLYFPAWRALEGSVVTIGADPEALVGRARKTRGDLSRRWRSAVEEMFRHDEVEGELGDAYAELAAATARLRAHGVSDFGTLIRLAGGGTEVHELVSVESEGRKVMLPQWAVSQLQGSANTQLQLALDLRADGSRWDEELEVGDVPEVPAVALEEAVREDATPVTATIEQRLENLMASYQDRMDQAHQRISGSVEETIRRMRMR